MGVLVAFTCQVTALGSHTCRHLLDSVVACLLEPRPVELSRNSTEILVAFQISEYESLRWREPWSVHAAPLMEILVVRIHQVEFNSYSANWW